MKLYMRETAAQTAAGLHDAAYALLLEALAADWGVPAPRVEKTERGKPYLLGENMPHISLSHTSGLVCCAVSDVPCGVDCERLRPLRPGVLRRVCTEREIQDIEASEDPAARFLLYWTVKEALSKLSGDGMAGGFRRFALDFSGGTPQLPGFTLTAERHGAFFIATAE